MSDIGTRILDDDELIDLEETRKILGGISISTAYNDPELMTLRINMTAKGRRVKMIRFVKREILDLRVQRAQRSEANVEKIREEVEARVERRRSRQRLRKRAAKVEAEV